MYSNANNLKSEIVWSVSANDSTVSITPGEWVLRANNTVACLEHYENEICTKREVIKITSISDNTLTITRSFAVCIMNDKTKEKGDTAFSFDEWDFLSMYLSKELRESLTDWVGENQTAYETMLENLAVPRTCINNCLTTRQSAIDTAYRTKFWWLAWFWNGSDWDCVISEDTFLDAWREYNFRNLTICPDVLVRFEWAGVPTINVRDTFRNCWIIELKAPYVPDCSILENRCITWKSVNNICTDWWPCCGGKGWARQSSCGGSSGCDWCPWTETSWWYGWDAYWSTWCAPDWLNGWMWANWCYQLRWSWWGWGWWWGWRYWNWWRWWNGGKSYCPSGASKWWDGWNSWLYGTGWTGWTGWSICEDSWWGPGWNWWSGYYGWEWWIWRADVWWKSSWDWWCWVIEWWKGWDAWCNKQSCGWNWWNAITNVYWFHLNARCIYNYCVNSRGGKGWVGGNWDGSNCDTWYAKWWKWWNGANGGQMIINYCCMFEEWCFDVRGGEGWLWWRTYACESWYECKKHRAVSWCVGADGWKVLHSSANVNVRNIVVYAFWDNTKLSREDVSAAPSTWVERWKTVVVYSTETYPETPSDWTLVVENTIRNQYKDTPYTLTLAKGTYYFSFFVYDAEDNLTSTAQQTLHIIWNVQYAIVWGGAGWGWGVNGGTFYWCGWGWGWGWEVLYWTTTIWWKFCTIIGQWWCWWCWELQENWCNWWDTYFWKEIAHWWGWGWAYCCVWLDWWNGWGWGSDCVWWATTWTWYTWWNGDRRWAWGWGWAFGAWSSCVFGWNGGAWKYFYFNTTCCCCCPIGWGWGGWACVGCRCYWTWWAWWWGWGGCDGRSATWYWWGGWGWGAWCSSIAPYTNWWNWCQGAVLISYPCSCTYNITWANETFTCCSYTVHIINTDWTLCIL